jgi:hypothetical protein
MPAHRCCTSKVNPNVAKVGGLQSQNAEGEAIVGFCSVGVKLSSPSRES